METLLKNAKLVNEGKIVETDIFIIDDRIERIDTDISPRNPNVCLIDLEGLLVIPGVIDDQVHFREPGLTQKAEIYTESRAAVAGGITTFIEQPNTKPAALTQELLEQKYQIASQRSAANYSFTMGTSVDNLEEALKTNKSNVAGIKVFMGSSTGNMLVDEESVLEGLFSRADHMIITHCEDEATIKANIEKYTSQYGDDIPMRYHPIIRSGEACYLSSSRAVALAKKHNTRLHVYHISTEKETSLFDGKTALAKKRITSEVCVHHLWFNDSQYDDKGSLIKWNPAVKKESDRQGLWKALKDGKLDVIATDHAPHTLEEKQNPYTSAPSGGPLVQHALVSMLEFVHKGEIGLEFLVEKMCHNPAIAFNIKDRGFVREGYKADLTVFEMHAPWKVNKGNILYKCGWSPFEGLNFKSRVTHTFVNGELVYNKGRFNDTVRGERLLFDRD